MAKGHSLTAEPRSGSLGQARQQGFLPAVLYGHGLKSVSLQVPEKEFAKVFSAAGSTSLVALDVAEGKEHTVIIREVQYHPVHRKLLHVDFYQVRLDEPIRAEVPLRFIGESPAVKDQGGVLVRSLDTIDLEALPQHLPHDIEIDISVLDDFAKVIRIADLNLPAAITLFHEQDDVVALVQAPRTQEEIDEELAEATTADVTAVEGVADKEVPAAEGAEGAAADGADKQPADQSKKKSE